MKSAATIGQSFQSMNHLCPCPASIFHLLLIVWKHCSDPLLRPVEPCTSWPSPSPCLSLPSAAQLFQGPRACLHVPSSLVRGAFPNQLATLSVFNPEMSHILLFVSIFVCLFKIKSLPRDSHPYPRTENFLRGSSYFLCSLLYLAHSLYSLPSYPRPTSLMTYGEARVPSTLTIIYSPYKISSRFWSTLMYAGRILIFPLIEE